TDHFVVGGFTAPEGSRKWYGALLLGLYKEEDLIYVGRTGGGFDDHMLAETYKMLKPLVINDGPFDQGPAEVRKAHRVETKLVCEVRFNEWTNDKKLRAPIFQGFRDDINPQDCRLEDSIPERGLTVSGTPPTTTPKGAVVAGGGPLTVSPRSSKIEFTNLD